MAEMALWAADCANSISMRAQMTAICKTLKGGALQASHLAGATATAGPSAVVVALEELGAVLGGGGPSAEIAAAAFGRLGGHQYLLRLLAYEGADEPEGTERDLAGIAADLSMKLCPRFPMQSAALDAENEKDTMQCELVVDSSLNATPGAQPLIIHLARRANPGQDGAGSAVVVSNMLWAAGVVMVRYLQAFPALLSPANPTTTPLHVLEVGAGLGAAGLGVALLTRQLGLPVSVCCTDVDRDAVEMIRVSIRGNRLGPPGEERTGATAAVLDWDDLDAFAASTPVPVSYDLLLGAEVVHEMSHAAGVIGAVRRLMAPGGTTVIVMGSSHSRYGVEEFQALLRQSVDLHHTLADVPAALTGGLESVKDGLVLQVYSITWTQGHGSRAVAAESE